MIVFASFLSAQGGCSAQVKEKPIPKANTNADAKRVLLVINKRSALSADIGEYYIRRRQIPRENVIRVDIPINPWITEEVFKSNLDKPIRNALARNGGLDFVVLTDDIPIRFDKSGYSVDGFIAAQDLPVTPIVNPNKESVMKSLNPYFGKNEPFSRKKFGMVLVTRLMGYELDHVRKLIDNSVKAKFETGPFFFDQAANRSQGSFGELNEGMLKAVQGLRQQGYSATLESSETFLNPGVKVMGYCSWGSNDSNFRTSTYRSVQFKPGAIAETFVSTSGRTFRRTNDGGQSLIADLIEQGVTGVKGYVSEPYTFSLCRPEILFSRYANGFNLAEAMYMASPIIKYKDIVIGDPLCRPNPPRSQQPKAKPLRDQTSEFR